MARLISTEEEFNAWDAEIEPDVDIKLEVIQSLHEKHYLDDFGSYMLALRYAV